MNPNGHLIGHTAAGHEHSSFFSENFCRLRFQLFNGRVDIDHRIAKRSDVDGLPHFRGGLRDGVAAEVDHETVTQGLRKVVTAIYHAILLLFA